MIPENYRDLEKKEQLKHINTLRNFTKETVEKLAVLVRQHNIPEDLFYYAGDLIHEARRYILYLELDFRKNRIDSDTHASVIKCLEYIKHIEVLLELISLKITTSN